MPDNSESDDYDDKGETANNGGTAAAASSAGSHQAPSKCSYHDYSKEPTEDGAITLKKDGVQNFPMKLHTILSNSEFSDIISWLPHGRAWRILQHKAFEERVIPLFFRHGRYSSFARQVNGWGFKRISAGPDYNSYYHELFLRGLPHLSQRMKRVSTKEGKSTGSEAVDHDGEQVVPDFYAISRENPIPDLPSESEHQSHLPGLSLNTKSPTLTGLGMGGKSSGLPSTAPPASSVNDEIALLEQRRRELLLLQLATLQGSQGNQNSHQGYNIPPAPAHQLDLNGNSSQLLAMLAPYGLANNMPTNHVQHAGLANPPLPSAATMQQLLAFQQLAPAPLPNAIPNNINWNDLLNHKPPAAAATPAPGALNLSQQLNGVNLQALLSGGSNNPAAALQQLLGNLGNHSSQASGGDGVSRTSQSQAISENGGATSSQSSSQGQSSVDDVQKLLQAAAGNGCMTNDALEGLKRQMGVLQNAPSAPQASLNTDWQRQLGLMTAAASNNLTLPQPPAATNVADLLAQLQRQAAGGSTNNALTTQELAQRQHSQESNGVPSSLRTGNQGSGGSGQPQSSSESQVADMQRLLTSGGGANANELIAMLLGNSGGR
ncbi:hypothetical protein MPSEU_000638600 [Mayamaea pseudoterrestris]|nr:hypothetical protein MPSEU_000638600 [Mayamaea pseudoterrestris]